MSAALCVRMNMRRPRRTVSPREPSRSSPASRSTHDRHRRRPRYHPDRHRPQIRPEWPGLHDSSPNVRSPPAHAAALAHLKVFDSRYLPRVTKRGQVGRGQGRYGGESVPRHPEAWEHLDAVASVTDRAGLWALAAAAVAHLRGEVVPRVVGTPQRHATYAEVALAASCGGEPRPTTSG